VKICVPPRQQTREAVPASSRPVHFLMSIKNDGKKDVKNEGSSHDIYENKG
jgi:hypothetical protein